MTAEFVEFEISRALEWLGSERMEARRLPAVLVLRELAENAPTLVHPYIEVRTCVLCVCQCVCVCVCTCVHKLLLPSPFSPCSTTCG